MRIADVIKEAEAHFFEEHRPLERLVVSQEDFDDLIFELADTERYSGKEVSLTNDRGLRIWGVQVVVGSK